MKYRGLLLALTAVVALQDTPVRAATSRPVVPAVPSSIVELVTLPGYPAVRALALGGPSPAVVLVRTSGSGAVTVWKESVDATPSELAAPGPKGLFFAVTPAVKGHEAGFYAYRYTGSAVQSAIAGHPKGTVRASAGIRVRTGSVLALVPDTTHQGSVRYANATEFRLANGTFSKARTFRLPDYAPRAEPTPRATVKTAAGDHILLRLEIADTPQKQETGLMGRTSLDPDSGMIFVFPALVDESFWMENTPIPLSIAFLGPTGQIQEIQDMAADTTELHTPALEYRYAIEANLGFFTANRIRVGDRFVLHLSTSNG